MDHIFFLKIENDICSAHVTKIDHPYHQLYHVLFEDGYENNFFTNVETGRWIEEDLGETALAINFGMKLYMLNGTSGLHRKPLSWCKASMADDVVSFAFYKYTDGAEKVFEVYADNHKFLYTLRRSGKKWKVFGPLYCITADRYTDQVNIIISIFKGIEDCI
jgi:hypothetical protein